MKVTAYVAFVAPPEAPVLARFAVVEAGALRDAAQQVLRRVRHITGRARDNEAARENSDEQPV